MYNKHGCLCHNGHTMWPCGICCWVIRCTHLCYSPSCSPAIISTDGHMWCWMTLTIFNTSYHSVCLLNEFSIYLLNRLSPRVIKEKLFILIHSYVWTLCCERISSFEPSIILNYSQPSPLLDFPCSTLLAFKQIPHYDSLVTCKGCNSTARYIWLSYFPRSYIVSSS